ncbi:MAG: BMP family ABC transporter substrate-binding protein [Hominicoprocola sp.]
MKKFFALLLSAVMVLSLVACGQTEDTPPVDDGTEETVEYAVAMVTDYGDITDQSFNQTTYEACKEYCEAQGLSFNYFKPAGDSTADRVAMIEKAVDEGFNIIVMPGYAFAGAIQEAAPQYPDVKFVALDVSKGDYLEAGVGAAGESYDYNPDNWDLAKYVDLSNVYTMIYQEELCGYMAGYATVKLGYTKLGFCGGMAVPAVVRYGYGFVQGADAAAAELGVDASIQYAYANQFWGDSDITAAMDTMYAGGVECIFACGGGVFTSVAEAAAKVGGKVVGVDVDQAPIIDAWGEGMTVTSAMKGLASSTKAALKGIVEDDNWTNMAGKIDNLGLVSATDLDANFVGIPTGEGTQFSDSFTKADLEALVADLYSGKITVSNDVTAAVTDMAKTMTVNDLGNIK